MRGNSIAVRIPRIIYQTTSKNVQVSGKAPQIERRTPKEIVRQSREYIRTLTPSSQKFVMNSPSNKPFEPIPSQSIEQTSFKALKINTRPESVNKVIKSLPISPNVATKSCSHAKRHENYFDIYVKEKEIDLSQENELFPKEMNEKIHFLPNPYNFEFLVWGEPKYGRKIRPCQQNSTHKNLKSPIKRRTQTNFIKKIKIEEFIERPSLKFPKYYKNKPIAKSFVF